MLTVMYLCGTVKLSYSEGRTALI